jgi:hypothetical protein
LPAHRPRQDQPSTASDNLEDGGRTWFRDDYVSRVHERAGIRYEVKDAGPSRGKRRTPESSREPAVPASENDDLRVWERLGSGARVRRDVARACTASHDQDRRLVIGDAQMALSSRHPWGGFKKGRVYRKVSSFDCKCTKAREPRGSEPGESEHGAATLAIDPGTMWCYRIRHDSYNRKRTAKPPAGSRD